MGSLQHKYTKLPSTDDTRKILTGMIPVVQIIKLRGCIKLITNIWDIRLGTLTYILPPFDEMKNPDEKQMLKKKLEAAKHKELELFFDEDTVRNHCVRVLAIEGVNVEQLWHYLELEQVCWFLLTYWCHKHLYKTFDPPPGH